jgi:hypothetical protein
MTTKLLSDVIVSVFAEFSENGYLQDWQLGSLKIREIQGRVEHILEDITR